MATVQVPKLKVTVGPLLTAEDARAIFAQGEEAAIYAMLELANGWAKAEGRCASVSSPATPSAMKPVHQKPTTTGKKAKKPGRKAGHPGSRRAPPTRIDAWKDHRADIVGEN